MAPDLVIQNLVLNNANMLWLALIGIYVSVGTNFMGHLCLGKLSRNIIDLGIDGR